MKEHALGIWSGGAGDQDNAPTRLATGGYTNNNTQNYAYMPVKAYLQLIDMPTVGNGQNFPSAEILPFWVLIMSIIHTFVCLFYGELTLFVARLAPRVKQYLSIKDNCLNFSWQLSFYKNKLLIYPVDILSKKLKIISK